MKTILVATDFSPAALNATHYAADMAITIKADLLLLTVVQTPIGYSDLPIMINLEDMLRTTEKDISQLKEALQLKTNGKINIEAEVGMGSFFSELKSVCERVNPYAVVMGSQGKTATEHLMFGTHAVHAMKELTWPLITVPPGAGFSAIKKIGLASDLSEVIKTTPADEIKMLVTDFNAALHILNIGKQEVFEGDIVFESEIMREMLMSLKPTFHFISNENTDDALISFAEKNDLDLLIVLPKHHNLLHNLFQKSHTKNLVLHSHVPVMALHR